MNLLRKLFGGKSETKNNKDQFSYVTEFKDGYALAIEKVTRDTNWSRIVIVNQSYNVVAEMLYIYQHQGHKDDIEWLNGYIRASNISGNYILLNKDLRQVKKCEHSFIDFYHWDGVDVIEIADKKGVGKMCYGLLNKNLETLLQPEFEAVKYLGNHIVIGIKNGHTVILNLITGQKTEVLGKVIKLDMQHGRKHYKFSLDGKYGYYDENGQKVIQPDIDFIFEADEDGLAVFRQGYHLGVANIETGRTTIYC